MQPQLGATEQPEAQIEHLQREAVSRRLFVLPHETTALQDRKKTVDRRHRQPQQTTEFCDAQTPLRAGERLAHVERFLERCLGVAFPPIDRSAMWKHVPIPQSSVIYARDRLRKVEWGELTY